MIKINPTNQQFKPTFGSTPLYNLRVKKKQEDGNYKLVNATFTEIDPKDTDDQKAISELEQTSWNEKQMFKAIKNQFKEDSKRDKPFRHFYAIEYNEGEPYTKQEKLTGQKILSLASVNHNYSKNYSEVLNIQADPEAKFKTTGDNSNRTFKHAGAMLLYGTLRQAKEKFEKRGLMGLPNSQSLVEGFFKQIEATNHVMDTISAPDDGAKAAKAVRKLFKLDELPEIKA